MILIILVIFFCRAHLLDMFHHSKALSDVVKSVATKADTLLQTGGLAFSLIFVYSTVGFLLFPDKFSFDAPGKWFIFSISDLSYNNCIRRWQFTEVIDGDKSSYNVNGARCDSLWKCFLVTADMVNHQN